MEHNELDELFRKQLQNDDADLSEQELHSKQEIWKALDKPRKSITCLPVRPFYSFWKIAAAVLLLTLVGSSWFYFREINQRQERYTQLDKNYNKMFTSLKKMEKKLENSTTDIVENTADISQKNKKTTDNNRMEILVEEKIVLIRDTIWLEKNIAAQNSIQLVRDTIFIEVEKPAPAKLVNSDSPKTNPEKEIKKSEIPKKIEFVFGKKPLEKPSQKNRLILINDTEVAKKTDSINQGSIVIPIKN